MTRAKQMIAVLITFRKCNKISLERRIDAYWCNRKKVVRRALILSNSSFIYHSAIRRRMSELVNQEEMNKGDQKLVNCRDLEFCVTRRRTWDTLSLICVLRAHYCRATSDEIWCKHCS